MGGVCSPAGHAMARIKALKSTIVFRKLDISTKFAIHQNTDVSMYRKYINMARYDIAECFIALFDISFISISSIHYLPHILSQRFDIGIPYRCQHYLEETEACKTANLLAALFPIYVSPLPCPDHHRHLHPASSDHRRRQPQEETRMFHLCAEKSHPHASRCKRPSFKERKSIELRREEILNIRRDHPHKIPVIVERYRKEVDLPLLEKEKYLVPSDVTMSQFLSIIRSRLVLAPNQAFYLIVNNKFLASMSKTMGEIYHEEHDPDGFLYMVYASQEMFG
ncbi:hypothetical protein RvY_17192 [Ramazzottius varieornatus]|uniref:Autophagy-related protein n=1 Tax=Ramazzottius varieornatus TaxID=947166 RepID=A0A1D1W3L4_RAMVA|nr:hypothetical protein RvY_17192 [Ramazzottius varieornatus]